MVIIWHNLSIVTSLIKVVVTSLQLMLVKIIMFLGDWINLPYDIPVNCFGTWWSGYWTFVNPSRIGINHVHQVSIWNLTDNWVIVWRKLISATWRSGESSTRSITTISSSITSITTISSCFFLCYCFLIDDKLIPFKWFKENIDNMLLFWWKLLGEVFNWEHNTNSSVSNSWRDGFVGIIGDVNGMHLEIMSLTVNSMLRTSMEMELNTCISWWCSQISTWVHRLEGLKGLTWFVNGNLSCKSSPHYFNFSNLVGVDFLKVIGTRLKKWKWWSFKIDWTLHVCTTLWESVWPISTILFVIVSFSITSIDHGSQSEEE